MMATRTRPPANDLVFVNGTVYTGEPAAPWAEAMWIERGEFRAIGTIADVRAAAPASSAVVDLDGRFVMPGIYDTHCHPDLALAPGYSGNLDVGMDDPTPEDVAEAIIAYAAAHPEREWIYGLSFVFFTFRQAGIVPDRHWLDSVLPDRPVAIHDRSWGCLLVNSRALELAGIDAETSDPRNGSIERDPLSDEPTGILVDGAYSLVYAAMPPVPQQALRRAYRDAAHFQSSRGVVGAKYVHVCEHRLDALKWLDDSGQLSLRVEAAISWQDDIFPVRRRWQLIAGERHYYRSDRLNVNAVKFHFDGTHEARSSFLASPDSAGWQGRLNLTPEHLADMVADMDRVGIRVIAHCTGDGASNAFLDAVAAARSRNGSGGPMHQCAHSTILLDADLARFAELDVVAEFSPVGWQPTPFAYARHDAFGDERMARAYNFAGVLAADGVATMGTDWPVSDPDPWIGFEAMITRRIPDDPSVAAFFGEPITLEQAIAVMTVNGATSMGMADRCGTIVVGKAADLIVLDQNPFDIEIAGNLHATNVDLTLVDGNPTWDPHGLLDLAGRAPTWTAPVPEVSGNPAIRQ